MPAHTFFFPFFFNLELNLTGQAYTVVCISMLSSLGYPSLSRVLDQPPGLHGGEAERPLLLLVLEMSSPSKQEQRFSARLLLASLCAHWAEPTVVFSFVFAEESIWTRINELRAQLPVDAT